MEILRRGSEGAEVRRWQHFLLGQELLTGSVDGIFGPLSEASTRAFQKRRKLTVDGVVGPQTIGAALQLGLDLGFTDPLGGTSGPDWPPPPVFRPLVSNLERGEVFGAFRFEPIPGKDDIRILGDWVEKNIVTVRVPQLIGIEGAPSSGRIRLHRKISGQVQGLFQAWEDAGLRDRLLTWAGSFVPRFIRGSRTTLSNHAWGTAFDINVAWNARGTVPALRGEKGSVRELVPIANSRGFYWGGHFSRRDGMHFEASRLLG